MSRHWLALSQETLEEAKDVTEVLKKIAQKNPGLAHQLSQIDWSGLREHIIKQALQDTAAHFGVNLRSRFDTKGGFAGYNQLVNPAGTILGVLHSGDAQFGVVMNKGCAHIMWSQLGHETDQKSEQIEEWKRVFEERRQVRDLEAMAQIFGEDVQSTTDTHDTTMITFIIEEAKS